MAWITTQIAEHMVREGGELLARGADLRPFSKLPLAEKLARMEAGVRAAHSEADKIIAENRARRAAQTTQRMAA